jgi:hypothetical protein
MSLTERDRKIVIVLVPLVMLLGYWFLILGPKRDEASKLGEQLTEAQQTRDDASSQAAQLEGSKDSYAKDYETVVRLGKAIPATLDMPSLLVQLEDASKGTGIRFSRVRAGDRTVAPTAPAPSTSGTPGQGGDAAAGGQQATTGAGKATEKANNAAQTSNSASSAAGATTTDTTTSTTAGASADGTTSATPGLDSVPLEFTFRGSFFNLADFFHRMKRFVRVANKDIRVKGRLMTIDSLAFKSDQFPVIVAEVKSTVYLSPKTQGTTAGATPEGPATDGSTPASTSASNPAAPAPASSPVAQTGDDAR